MRGEEDVDVAWAWAMAWAPNLSRLSWTQPVVDLMANLSRAVSFGVHVKAEAIGGKPVQPATH